MTTEILCKDLSHSFGSLPVIDRLNLRIPAGDFVAILGPSGCGKSTLLRIIAELESVQSGRIEFDRSPNDRIERSRGFVFQDARLLPWRDVIDNVATPLELLGLPLNEARKRAAAYLDRARYHESRHVYPSALSGGMKMRVSLARALSVDPSLLLLDEPFAALDERSRNALQVDLRDLWLKTKMTTVFVTHSLSEAVFLASRVILLSYRPAKICFDETVQLSEKRTEETRLSLEYLNEIRRIENLRARYE